ncbi:MAG: alpha/beta hydrolase [Alphaproteobacteria bacterium]|nr:alpha/beta hydrolase [Alphaproteobacteria bacterium]
MNKICVSLLALAGLGATPVSARERIFPVADKPVLEDRYPERINHFPGGVTGHADVVYSVLPGYRPLIVDIYTPPKSVRPKPLILYIHGGGWLMGHTRHSGALTDFPNVLARLASEGFVVASLEYRLSGEAPFPAQIQDARAALRFLKGHAARYGIDPQRVGLWGGSAGGHLTALAALSCGYRGFDVDKNAPQGSECVQAAVTWYGVFDMAPLMARQSTNPKVGYAENQFLHCQPATCPAERIAEASPVSYIHKGNPPFLMIHGEADTTVPVAQSKEAEARMRAAGVPVKAIYIPGVNHSFIGSSPAQTRAATLLATNATFDFFHQVLDK